MVPHDATVGDLIDLMSRRPLAHIKDRLAAVVERRRGKSLRGVARAIKRSVSFVKTWNDRFKALGARALLPTASRARRSKLDEEQRQALKRRILAGPIASDKFAVFTMTIPPNITLCPLPPYCPELNPIERLWLRIKVRYLTFRLYRDTDAIISAGVAAWNMVTAAEVMSVCRAGASPAR